jgi:outer membrane biosynthesis protein TonB
METLTLQTPLDSRFTEFNIRQDVGTPHFVRLHDNATKRFEAYVRSIVPTLASGSSAGGILLGTIQVTDQWSATVLDFTPVVCEHRRDGRSTFLDCPAQCFKNAIRRASQSGKKNLSIVGYYRSHARPEFSPEKEDHDLFKKYFPQDARFLLLLKPSPAGFALGVFYLGLDGQLHPERSSVEFPMSLKELGAEEPPEVEEPAAIDAVPSAISENVLVAAVAAPAPAAPPAPAPAPVVQNAPSPLAEQLVQESRRSEQFWKGAAVAAILLGSVFAVRSLRTPSEPYTPVAHPAPATSAPPVAPGRTVETNAPEPRPDVPQAPQAPARTSDLPQSPTVTAAPGKSDKVPSAPRPEVRTFSPPASPKPVAPASVLSAPPELPNARSVTPIPAPALPSPPSSVAAPPSNPVNSPANQPASAPPEPARSSPPAVTNAAPKGPLSPPRVVRQVNPAAPESVKRKLHGELLIRVLVDVDANGKVKNAVALTKGDKLTDSLAALAVEAARQSQFEPAKQGDQKVDGQATLQFRFEKDVIRLPVQPAIR